MIKVTVPGEEYYDDEKEEFVTTKPCTLQLEHSLISISKWEQKWKKAFLKEGKKTREETLDYIRCMTLNGDVPDIAYYRISDEDLTRILDYIDDPMTATTFHSIRPDGQSDGRRKQIVTSELLYYQMIMYGIPVEFQKWHLNRLLTLIHVCSIKNAPPGSNKMSKRQTAQHYAALNAARRKH